VIVATAQKRRAPLRLIDRDFTISHAPTIAATPLAGGTLLLQAAAGGGPELAYPLSMAGRHQADNAGLAVMTIGELCRRGFRIPETAVRAGLASVHLPARIERIADRPLVILDAAHNVASMESLVATLAPAAQVFRPTVLVFAASADKQIAEMLAVARGRFDHVVVTRYATNPRAATVPQLVEACRRAGLPAPQVATAPAEALRLARSLATARGLVCVAGSFFLAAEIRAVL
jgi:dihydrofolate synthase/folylpolyglutamate synthase